MRKIPSKKPARTLTYSSKTKSGPLTVQAGGGEILQSNQYKSLALRSMFWRPDYLQGPSAWIEHLPFAFWIVEALQPTLFVELGTHYGHSYFSFCQAIKRLGLNTPSYGVDTWKGDDQAGHYDDNVHQQVESYNQANYPEFSSLLRCTFDEALNRFNEGSIDLLHIDGFHTYEAVRHDFESWLPKLSDRAVVLFHDTNVRRDNFGVHKYFSELSTKYPFFEFIHGHGLGVLGVGKEQPELLRSLYSCYDHQTSRNIVYQLFSRLGRSCHDLMDLLGSREHIVKQQQHIAHIEQVAGEKGAEIERLNEELARLNKEVDSTNEQKANLEELTASRSMEVDRLVGEVTRLDEEATTLKTHIVHLEQVAGEGRAEIERLNGEVSRLNVEATAKASHHEHLEQVAGERSVEVERLITKLSDKSETLDRYIQESAQMARMIIEAQDDRNAWRRMSVTAEIEEVILGSRHEVGEHQHLNYTLRGIKHLGRKFNQLDVRIVDHRGNPGILIFEPNPEERAFYGWTKTGEENGRKFMLVIPSDKWGKDFLIRCTTNDILLVKDITANINKELLKKQSLSNKKWEIMCSEILKSICINGMKLHYDDVVVLDNKKNKHEIKIINPLIDFKIIEYNNIVITKNQITSISNNTTKIEYNKNKLNSETKKVFEHYNKENKNFLYHISKNINNF